MRPNDEIVIIETVTARNFEEIADLVIPPPDTLSASSKSVIAHQGAPNASRLRVWIVRRLPGVSLSTPSPRCAKSAITGHKPLLVGKGLRVLQRLAHILVELLRDRLSFVDDGRRDDGDASEGLVAGLKLYPSAGNLFGLARISTSAYSTFWYWV